ncbi:hypothetical protein [Streptomyces sp. NPDC091212]|uniref:hypothetical protein n=1 Tax=Streptomyces sp. NPDC091212 TaxID=3155191 RepID=UPI00343EA02D
MASRRLPPLPQYQKDGVTRRLCASAHLDEDFARHVHREFTADRMTAVGLPLGVNLLALVRHATAAVRRFDTRDRRLARLSAGALGAVVVALYGLAGGSSTVVGAGCAGLLAALGTAWWLVHAEESAARDAAFAVFRSGTKPEELATPVSGEVEDRLRELRRANVVPYTAAAERTNPFVGSGTKIKESVWQPIDISRPAADPAGGKLTITPFDAVDLHTYIAREMENIAGLEGLRAQNRLYVLGTHVRLIGGDLLPDPLGRPRARISPKLVQSGLVQPGAGARTYLSLERIGEGGRIIVSMHLRARLQHPSLSWEVAAYAIPPVGGRHYRVDTLPIDGFERWWSLVRYASGRFWPALRGAAGRGRRRTAEQNRRRRELEKWRKDIGKRHAVYDHGAVSSLREWVSSWDGVGHSERTDSQDFLHRLQQGVLIATEKFLKDHHVDTGSFDQAQQVINAQTYNFSGDVTGPSNFGNNGQIAYGPGQQPAGAPAGP